MILTFALCSCSAPEPALDPRGPDIEETARHVPQRTAEELHPNVSWLSRWAVVGTPHYRPPDPRLRRANDGAPQPNVVAWDAIKGIEIVASDGGVPYEVLQEMGEYHRLSAFRVAEMDSRGCEVAAHEWIAKPAHTPDEERRNWWIMKRHCESALEPWRAQGAERADLDRVAAIAEEARWWSR